MLVSSHVLAEMAQTVDEVVVISRGKLVAQGSLDELTQGVEAPIWVRSPEPERLRAALAAREGVDAEPAEAGGGWLEVRGAHARGSGHHRGRERHPRVRALPAAPVARARVPGAHRGHGGGPVIRLIGAELLKIRTTRTFWALTGGAVGLVLLIVVLSLSLDDSLGHRDGRARPALRGRLQRAAGAGARRGGRRGRVQARHDRLDAARHAATACAR